jgi:hypothetical protein
VPKIRKLAIVTMLVVIAVLSGCGQASGGAPRSPSETLSNVTPLSDARPLTKAYVENVYRQRPGIVLPLPKILPAGFTFEGFSASASENGRVASRTAEFSSATAFVTLCVQTRPVGKSPCGRKSGDRSREFPGTSLVINVSPASEPLGRQWQEVAYVLEPAQVSWLR